MISTTNVASKLYVNLERLGALNVKESLKVENKPYMPLNIEKVYDFPVLKKGNYLLSLSHTYIQNGDLMRDPEIVFEIDPDNELAEPLSYLQDSLALYQQVYTYKDGKRAMVYPKRKREISDFCFRLWLPNLRRQGFSEIIKEKLS